MTQSVRGCTKAPRLTPRQEAACLAIAGGKDHSSAARESGAAVRTIKAWMTLPHFKKRIRQLREEATERAVNRLATVAADAVKVIVTLMYNSTSQYIQLQAAQTVLDRSCKLTDLSSLQERLASVEEQLKKLLPTKRNVA